VGKRVERYSTLFFCVLAVDRVPRVWDYRVSETEREPNVTNYLPRISTTYLKSTKNPISTKIIHPKSPIPN